MAVATGSQIRPELSAVNYTPYLQATGQAAQMSARGAENIGSALANLGQQAGNAIKEYKQNKEREKQYQGVIKTADTLSKGYEGIIERLNPRIATALSDLRSRITDPNISTVEKYSAAQSFLDNAPNLLNAGLKMADIESDSASKTAEINSKKAILEREQRIKSGGSNMALGQPVGVQLAPDELNEAKIFAAGVLEKGQTTKRVDEVVNGKVTPILETTNLITGQVSKSAISPPFQSAEDIAKGESKKEYIKSGAESLKKLDADLELARSQSEFADQLSDAIKSGATTGAFASASGTVKNVLESVFGGDYGASTQRLFEKGAKGMTMSQVRAMWKGLGSMSDTDLKEGVKTYGLISDPKKALEYYIESAKINRERLEQRKQLSKQLIKGGATQDDVAAQLDDFIAKEKPISQLARERIGFNIKPEDLKPLTPAEAAKLPSGTKFKAQDGTIRIRN